MDRVAIYVRVSQSQQAEMYGLDAQERICTDYAARHGWTVHNVYTDALSGKNDNRPGFQQMIADALDGQFGTVLVHKLDRFARNRVDSAVYKQLLRENGINILSATEPIDADTPAGVLLEGVLEAVAEWYRYNLRQETIKGMREKTKQGGWPRSAPVGYKNVRDGRRAWIEMDEVMGPRIARAFKMFSTGEYTLEQWADVAHKEGIRNASGKKVYVSQWSRIFHNRFYAGWVSWGDDVYPGAHTPLVDEEMFDRVQEILAQRDVDDAGFSWRYFYLLKGLVWSKDTSSRCTGATAKQKFRYYVSRKKLSNGKRHYIRADDLEHQVFESLMSISLSGTVPHCDERLALALQVSPSVGHVFGALNQDDKKAICKMVFEENGIVVSGDTIMAVNLKPSFSVNGQFRSHV